MKETTRKSLENWLKIFPEQKHPLDEQRKFEFVYQLTKNEDTIEKSDIYEVLMDCHSKYSDDRLDNVAENLFLQVECLMSFINYLKNKGIIK